jgi:chorismate mutase / prephenate dehydratase
VGDHEAKLDALRAKIDGLDGDILKLLNERARCAMDIGAIKEGANTPYYVPEREKAVFSRLAAENPGPLTDQAVKAIYREIISSIRALEKKVSVGFLGPLHTFSHKAALRMFGATADLHPLATIPDIFTEVERKRIDYGVVPIESSMGGGVSDTLDRFLSSNLKIINEIMLEVVQNLLSKSPLEEITKVYSKDNALLQCRNWLKANLPHAALIASSSTAEAAKIAAEEPGAAAIGSELAAEPYDLNIVVARIEDSPHNYTRFLVIGRQVAKPTGKDKTSVLIGVRDHPGALYELLLPFAKAGVNLTRIESRPSRRKAWEYVFFIDLVGHAEDAKVRGVLDEVAKQSLELKVLGSFPLGDLEE